METLILLFLLQLKHYWADFGIQSYAQTVKKGVYGDLLGISHSLDHVIFTLIALMLFNLVHSLAALPIILVSIIEGVIHYHIDWIKVRFGDKNMFGSVFWNQFGLDQLAHQITYLVMVWVLLF